MTVGRKPTRGLEEEEAEEELRGIVVAPLPSVEGGASILLLSSFVIYDSPREGEREMFNN